MAESNYLIVGLGNPEPQYEGTRHNVGFLALDHFASRMDCLPLNTKFEGRYCRKRLFGRPAFLVKPMTYMNRSGRCVAAFVRFFKIPLSNILILHDDLDLSLGRVKIVARGGSGGHNGIRSLAQHLGNSNFARIKIGIGRPARDEKGRGVPVDRYVLARFTLEETKILSGLFGKTDQAIELFLSKDIDTCMNKINRG
ncbi:MAG TPA: aminoacyl-tRNA hydrolase [Desulfobulbaceae bacterium]|nr:aminoacyl-tRNA hydrolase [Desulfobulbaceae bacterium]